MDDSSSTYRWKSKYELKEKEIVECMKKIAVLESKFVQQAHKSVKEINAKDKIINELHNQLSRMSNEVMREIDELHAKF